MLNVNAPSDNEMQRVMIEGVVRKLIVDTYRISEYTMALKPAKMIEYDTIVIETEHIYNVRQTPDLLIKKACIDNWSTYEGRRDAVIYKTNFKRKVPIPINRNKQIYAFPTHATKDLDCHWIFCGHILHIIEDQKTNSSIIHFKNGSVLPINVSTHTLRKQYQRTLNCMLSFPIK